MTAAGRLQAAGSVNKTEHHSSGSLSLTPALASVHYERKNTFCDQKLPHLGPVLQGLHQGTCTMAERFVNVNLTNYLPICRGPNLSPTSLTGLWFTAMLTANFGWDQFRIMPESVLSFCTPQSICNAVQLESEQTPFSRRHQLFRSAALQQQVCTEFKSEHVNLFLCLILKAEVHHSFNTTAVWEQYPRSHY